MPLSQVLLSVMCGLGGAGLGTGLVLMAFGVPGSRPKWILAFGFCVMAAGWLISWILDRRKFAVKGVEDEQA